jgi:glutathione S-transferase
VHVRRGGAFVVDRAVKDRPFVIGNECTIADIGCCGRMVFMAEGGFEIDIGPIWEPGQPILRRYPASRCPMI